MSMLNKVFALFAELEVTYLTDPTPITSDAVEAFDVVISPIKVTQERNVGTSTIGALASYVSAQAIDATFKTYIKTNGTDAGMLGKLIQMCCMGESAGTFTFATTGQKSGTLHFYHDGTLQKINGARGEVQLDFTAGERGVATWHMIGYDGGLTTNAILAPTFEAGNALVSQSCDFEIGTGVNIGGVETLSIKQSGLQMFKDINNAKGFGSALCTAPDFMVNVDPEATAALLVAWETAINASTTYALNFVHGTGAGNIITITAPVAQITKMTKADRNGIVVANLELALRVDSSNSDPVEITVS